MWMRWFLQTLSGMFPWAIQQGDANGDGQLDISDAVAIVNYLLSKAPLDNSKLAAADVNGDGEVTITDAVMLVNMIGSQP
jgi:hypothetical protein